MTETRLGRWYNVGDYVISVLWVALLTVEHCWATETKPLGSGTWWISVVFSTYLSVGLLNKLPRPTK